jgi:hypothetical protein
VTPLNLAWALLGWQLATGLRLVADIVLDHRAARRRRARIAPAKETT